MFTDRFIKVPIMEYDSKHKELTGQEILRDSFEKINPMDISSYRPTYPMEEPLRHCVNIYFKNGNSTLAYFSIKEFEQLLNSYQKQ